MAVNKSQPSVSRTIAALEARLGVRLFEKGKRPLRPTEPCLLLAEQGRIIAQASERATQAINQYSGGKSGTARIAGTPIFMDGVIANMLASILSIMAGSDSLTVLPYSVVVMQSHTQRVTTLPVQLEHPERALRLLWYKDRPMHPAVTRFRRYLEAEFQGLANQIEQRGRTAVWRS